MSDYYSYRDRLPANKISLFPDVFKRENPFPEIQFFKLLMGELFIKNNISGIEYKQNIDYLTLGHNVLNITNVTSNYISILFCECDNQSIDRYFLKNQSNRKIFVNLLFELSHFFLKSESNNQTAAFVHVYRILEYMSYAFPLIYCAKSNDYRGTYNNLKSFLKNDGNELKFINNFTETLYKDNLEMLDLSATIEFEISNDDQIHELKSIFNSSFTNVPFVRNADGILEMKYKYLIDFIITLRNRYFHFAIGTGQNNIQPTTIDIEDIFKATNPIALNWLGNIYYEIFKFGILNQYI